MVSVHTYELEITHLYAHKQICRFGPSCWQRRVFQATIRGFEGLRSRYSFARQGFVSGIYLQLSK